MNLQLDDLTIRVSSNDLADIRTDWEWLLAGLLRILMISKFGDMFLEGKTGSVFWLATDTGDLTPIANNVRAFELMLHDDQNLENWFLPRFIEELENAGLFLLDKQVFSYKRLPIIGGAYTIENIEPTDVSLHFSITGQVFKQIKDMPDGTRIKIKLPESAVVN